MFFLDVLIFNRAYLFLSILADILQLPTRWNCMWSGGYLRLVIRTGPMEWCFRWNL